VPGLDAHVHVWDLRTRDQPWVDARTMAAIRRSFDPDHDLRAELDRAGFERAIVVQVLNNSDETAELLSLARERPWLAGVVGWIDVTSAAVEERIDHARTLGPLVGVRHQLQAEVDPGAWLERADVGCGLRILAARGLPFDLMLRPAQFEQALRLVRDHPALTFVVDHAGKPPIATGALEPWAAGMRAFAAQPNVVCKLSGLVTMAGRDRWTTSDLAPYADVVLDAFGPQRVMFGSDWPVCLLAAGYTDVVGALRELTARLTPEEAASVWSGTACAVYGSAP
jgi:L-fuconolactonase